MYIHRFQRMMSTFKLPNQGTFWSLRSMTARFSVKHSGHNSRIIPCTIDGARPNSYRAYVSSKYAHRYRRKQAGLWYWSNELKMLTKMLKELTDTESKFGTDKGRLVSLYRVCIRTSECIGLSRIGPKGSRNHCMRLLHRWFRTEGTWANAS